MVVQGLLWVNKRIENSLEQKIQSKVMQTMLYPYLKICFRKLRFFYIYCLTYAWFDCCYVNTVGWGEQIIHYDLASNQIHTFSGAQSNRTFILFYISLNLHTLSIANLSIRYFARDSIIFYSRFDMFYRVKKSRSRYNSEFAWKSFLHTWKIAKNKVNHTQIQTQMRLP